MQGEKTRRMELWRRVDIEKEREDDTEEGRQRGGRGAIPNQSTVLGRPTQHVEHMGAHALRASNLRAM